MAEDGCQEVPWKGRAFPYLMHHEGFYKTESYGSHREKLPEQSKGQHSAASDTLERAGTGTWNGPAPRGSQTSREQVSAEATSIKDPDSVLLFNGMRLPLLGLGTFNIQNADVVKTALALGYRHLDCAPIYGNQAIIGEGLKDFIAAGHRSELFITSKIWNTCHRPALVRSSVEATLADLKCDYLDLCLMHWPVAFTPDSVGLSGDGVKLDGDVTIEQTWAAMELLVDAGLVKAIGVSNFSLAQVESLLSSSRIKPVVNEVELTPCLPQRKLVGVCFRKGVQCIAYSPLGSQGLFLANELLTHPLVCQIAQECGKSAAHVLLKWSVQRGVPAIPKASSEAHLRDNIEGLFEWRLTMQQKAALDSLECGKRFITAPWHTWPDPEEGGPTKPSAVL